jgi:hypothetical protein
MMTKTHQAILLTVFSIFAVLAEVWLARMTDSEEGKRIYRDGLLSSGQPLEAIVQSSLRLTGDQVACVNCHRRSGLGGSEGQLTARTVTGPALFNVFNAPHPKMYSSAAKQTSLY